MRARPWSTFFNVLPAPRESNGLVTPSVRLRAAKRRYLGEIKFNSEYEWPGSTLKNVLHGPSASAKCVSQSPVVQYGRVGLRSRSSPRMIVVRE